LKYLSSSAARNVWMIINIFFNKFIV
jgi:hypothetical protein